MKKINQTPEKKITILLTVYNRDSHTVRWLEFADFFKIPCPIFVSDGGSGNFVRDYIKNRNFKNIKVQYKKYKYYKNFKNFIEKFLLSTKKIKTKYTYLCEDDDFIIFENILKSFRYLEKNPDFVCSGGIVYGFDANFKGSTRFYNIKHLENFRHKKKKSQ